MNNEEALTHYKDFLKHNGNSENVIQLYYKRVRTFLTFRPEALTADVISLRNIIDDYITTLPMNTGLGTTATAVRYYWSSVFGSRYFKRMQLKDFPKNTQIEKEISEFSEYLCSFGRLKENTITPRIRMVKLFLYCQYGETGFDRALVTADVVRRHVSETMSYTTPSTKAGFSVCIRSYARFLETKGYSGNMKAILRIPLRGSALKSSLPKCMSDEDYSVLLDVASSEGSRSERDRAIILLMGNLGLRNCDVASLTLDDVDWKNGVLHVRNSKSITDRVIPLDSETGSALEAYVTVTRSCIKTNTRVLFLPAGKEVPGEAMSYQQIRQRVKHLAAKAGLTNYCGTHSLRRAVATNMTNNNVPIKTIADILGHESVSTTMGYLRVNIASLRQVCNTWPEGGTL
jgi:site-specific recombinase XerD